MNHHERLQKYLTSLRIGTWDYAWRIFMIKDAVTRGLIPSLQKLNTSLEELDTLAQKGKVINARRQLNSLRLSGDEFELSAYIIIRELDDTKTTFSDIETSEKEIIQLCRKWAKKEIKRNIGLILQGEEYDKKLLTIRQQMERYNISPESLGYPSEVMEKIFAGNY